MSDIEQPEGGTEGERKVDDLVLVIPFNSTTDLLIMSLREYEKFKCRGEITRASRRRKGKDDV